MMPFLAQVFSRGMGQEASVHARDDGDVVLIQVFGIGNRNCWPGPSFGSGQIEGYFARSFPKRKGKNPVTILLGLKVPGIY